MFVCVWCLWLAGVFDCVVLRFDACCVLLLFVFVWALLIVCVWLLWVYFLVSFVFKVHFLFGWGPNWLLPFWGWCWGTYFTWFDLYVGLRV